MIVSPCEWFALGQEMRPSPLAAENPSHQYRDRHEWCQAKALQRTETWPKGQLRLKPGSTRWSGWGLQRRPGASQASATRSGSSAVGTWRGGVLGWKITRPRLWESSLCTVSGRPPGFLRSANGLGGAPTRSPRHAGMPGRLARPNIGESSRRSGAAKADAVPETMTPGRALPLQTPRRSPPGRRSRSRLTRRDHRPTPPDP